MKSSFEKLYNTEIIIEQVKRSSGFYDDEETIETLGSVMADVQPYSGSRSVEEYGVSEEVNIKIFCEPTDLFKTDRIAKIGADKYSIVYIENWERYTLALLRKRND